MVAAALSGGLVVVGSQAASAQGPYLVTARAPQTTGDCATWATACTLSYALALEAANPGLICMRLGLYSVATTTVTSNSVINSTDLSPGNNGVVIRGGYAGTGVGCGPSAPKGITILRPSGLVGNAIIDFSDNNSITVDKLTVDSAKISYGSGQAPVLNSGGTGDTLGMAPLSPVTITGGAPPIAVDLTGGTTALHGVNVSGATHDGVLCTGSGTGCAITASRVSGSKSGSGIVLQGVTDQLIGGSTAALGNVVSGNGIGIDVTDGSSDNSIEHNTIDKNVLFGVVVSGVNAFPELSSYGGSGGTVTATDNVFANNTWTGNTGGANVIDFSGFSTVGDPSVGGTARTLASTCLSLTSTLAPFDGGSLSLANACTGHTPERLGPGTLIDISGAVNADGDDLSFFVASSVNVGASPTDVSVKPLIAGDGIASTTPAQTGVTANGQIPSLSDNQYKTGNACNPTAPNASTTLTVATGGGLPGRASGGETGYLAC